MQVNASIYPHYVVSQACVFFCFFLHSADFQVFLKKVSFLKHLQSLCCCEENNLWIRYRNDCFILLFFMRNIWKYFSRRFSVAVEIVGNSVLFYFIFFSSQIFEKYFSRFSVAVEIVGNSHNLTYYLIQICQFYLRCVLKIIQGLSLYIRDFFRMCLIYCWA